MRECRKKKLFLLKIFLEKKKYLTQSREEKGEKIEIIGKKRNLPLSTLHTRTLLRKKKKART